ncbi:MAG: bifunctional phosphoglucose/phosphomannose isomerase [Candidatus Zixiibacteriota bacterium]
MIEKLNDLKIIENLDSERMYDKIFSFPEQIKQAREIGESLNPNLQYYKNIKNIVIIGMGGSAIGGDLVRSYLSRSLKIPFYVCRNYRLPDFVDDNTLIIASSYSGNTEETLSALDDAMSRKAKVTCITTGGKLGEIAEKNDYMTAKLPSGYPPRSALGFSFVPLLFIMEKLGFAKDVDASISELVLGLTAYRKNYEVNNPVDKNPAKQLALKLYNKIPIIYSGPELTDAIGTRWKGQICENAKCLAFNNQFPEFNHNELVGWNIIDSYRDNLIVIYLRDSDDHPKVSQRMAVVRELIEKMDVEIVNIQSQGDFPLGRMFSLIQLGDFASFYLAILNGVNPTPVKAIDYLKNKLG